MTSKLKTDVLETVSGSGTIALTNQLTGMTSASVPTGSVIQVVHTAITSGSLTTSAQSYQNTPVVSSITPKSSSSKILVQALVHTYVDNHAADAWSASNFDVTRNGTQAFQTSSSATDGYTNASFTTHINDRFMQMVPISFLDSPNTTSEVTYRIRVSSRNGYNLQINSAFGYSNITLTEIQG